MLYLTLPFGWRASPWYFSVIGEGVTLARQGFISDGKNRDGADFVDAKLFPDDAIFIEPDIGRRKEAVISCCGHVCRSLLGESAINDEKVELEGSRNQSRILLGFGIDVDELTTRPTTKC